MTERSAAVKSAWAEGLTYFAVALLITVGIFQILQGLAAILDNRFYVAAPGHVFSFNITAWGWIHLVTGIVALAIGVGLFYDVGPRRRFGNRRLPGRRPVHVPALLPDLVDRHHRPRRGGHLGVGELPVRHVHVAQATGLAPSATVAVCGAPDVSVQPIVT